jgi:hypothetical protein
MNNPINIIIGLLIIYKRIIPPKKEGRYGDG